MSTAESLGRPIRSFVLRQGRITPGQKQGLMQFPQYGITLPQAGQTLDWQAIFQREAPRVLEIGFGMGATLVALAKAHPEMDFVGIEVHKPGVGRCLLDAHLQGLTNLKVLSVDVMSALQAMPAASFEKVYLLFPDPWPKKRHQKRRLVQPEFVNTIAEKLTVTGQFHLATDWEDYAAHMLEVLENCPTLKNVYGQNQFAPQNIRPFETKFEKRGKKLGHAIRDLVYT
jgi:tRNA (guanine-N7-)-methyltransferase